jgi:hypothetical protein
MAVRRGAEAAEWDPALSCEIGTMLGHEMRAMGFNMSQGSGINMIREPRNGRRYSEDPSAAHGIRYLLKDVAMENAQLKVRLAIFLRSSAAFLLRISEKASRTNKWGWIERVSRMSGHAQKLA